MSPLLTHYPDNLRSNSKQTIWSLFSSYVLTVTTILSSGAELLTIDVNLISSSPTANGQSIPF